MDSKSPGYSSRSSRLTRMVEDVSESSEASAFSTRRSRVAELRRAEREGSDVESERGASLETAELYFAIADYIPGPDDPDGLAIIEGQIVELVDGADPKRFLMRTRPGRHVAPRQGWVPSSYLEKKSFGESKRRTRELPDISKSAAGNKESEGLAKRDAVIRDIVDSEIKYVDKLKYVLETYIKALDKPSVPENLRGESEIFLNWKELCTFHETVLLPGLKFCLEEPSYIEKTFLRLERDFDKLTNYCRDEPEAQKLLSESPELLEFLGKITPFENQEEAEKTISDLLQLPVKRVAEYQSFIKELIKYTSRAKKDISGLQKTLEMLLGVPHRAQDIELLKCIKGYRGNIHKLGRIIRHDPVVITEDADPKQKHKDRHLFLFRDRILVTKMMRAESPHGTPPEFHNKGVIQLSNIDVKDDPADDERNFSLVDRTGSAGGVKFQAKSAIAKQAWVNEIRSLVKGSGGYPTIEVDDAERSTMSNVARSYSEDYDPRSVPDRSNFVDIKSQTMKTQTQSMEEMVADMQGKYLRVLTQTMTREEEYRELKSISEAPEFEDGTTLPYMRKSTEKISCVLGENVRFDCRVCGNPTPEVTWFKGNVELVAGDKFEFQTEGQIHSLIIKDCMPEDRGVYTCQAKNKNGTVRYHPELLVRGVFPVEVVDHHNWEYFHKRSQSVMDVESIHSEVADQGDFEDENQKAVPTTEDEKMDVTVEERKRHHEEEEEYVPKRKSSEAAAPKLHFVHFEDDTFTLKPKETLKIQIPYDGSPKPIVKFLKNGKPVISTRRLEIEDEENTAKLTIYEITKEDAGVYTIIVENSAGRDEVALTVEVRGLPEAPRHLKATDVTPETCMLKWEPPMDDGGNPILRYNVYRRGQGRKTWQKIATTREHHFEAENLLEDQAYEFRVTAENIVGEGEGAELQEPVLAKFTFGPPGPPDTPVVSSVGIRACTVSWNEPIADGGATIVGYLLERRNSISPHWVKVTSELIEGTEFNVPELLSSTIYEFRVIAVNKAGEGPPSHPSQPLKTRAWSVVGEDDENQSLRNYRPSMERSISNMSNRDLDDVFGATGSDVFRRMDSQTDVFRRSESFRSLSREPTESLRLSERRFNGESPLRSPSRQRELSREISIPLDEGETMEERIERRSRMRVHNLRQPSRNQSLEEMERKYGMQTQTSRSFSREDSYQMDVTSVSADREMRTISEKRHYDDVQSDTVLAKPVKQLHTERVDSRMSTDTDFSTEHNRANGDLSGMPGAVVQEDTIYVEQGRSLHINIPFFGNPCPTAIWKFNDNPIQESHRIRIDTLGNETSLNVKSMSAEDAGIYSLILENDTGRLEAHINVKILDAPSAPRNFHPIKEKTTPESVTLKWDEPEQSGGGPVINYILEKRIGGRKVWQGVTETATTEIVVENLLEGHEYFFRIKAENRYGIGPETETKEGIITKYPFNPPGPCAPPEVSEIRKSSAILSWEPPQDDGGSPVTGYFIERRYAGSSRFMKITLEPVLHTVFMVTDLVIGFEYEFRIVAVNLAGEGTPSKPCSKFAPNELADEHAPRVIPEGQTIKKEMEDFEIKEVRAKKHRLDEDDGNLVQRSGVNRATSEIASTVDEVESIREERNYTETKKPRQDKLSVRDEEEYDEISEISEITERTERRTVRRSVSKTRQKSMVDTGTDAAPFEQPKLRRPAKDQRMITLKEEDDLTLEIPYTGAPQPEFTWLKDGKPVQNSVQVQTDFTDEVARITVTDVRKENSGRYTLIAENAAGIDKVDIAVQVVDKRSFRDSAAMTEPGPEAPKLFVPKKFSDKVTQVEEHQPLNVEIPYSGAPIPKVTFMKDGKVITETRSMQTEVTEDIIRLLISDTLAHHAGEYTILAQNEVGSDQIRFTVQVLSDKEAQTAETKSAPKVEKPDKYHKEVQVGTDEQLHVEVPVSGSPRPDVQWSKNDKPLTKDERIQTDFKEDKASLTIEKVTSKDAGTYTVKATNEEGEDETSIVVEVVERSETITRTTKTRRAPKIRRPEHLDKTVQVRENDDLSLKIPFESQGAAEVSWLKDGKPVKPTSNVETQTTEDTAGISIKKVTKKDEGSYVLVVENEYGSDRMDVDIRVIEDKPTPSSQAPLIQRPVGLSKEIQTEEGQDLTVAVPCLGEPVPEVTLTKNGRRVAETERISTEVVNEELLFTIKDAKIVDAGTYKIVAENDLGVDETELCITVAEKEVVMEETETEKPSVSSEPIVKTRKVVKTVTKTQNERQNQQAPEPEGDNEGYSEEETEVVEITTITTSKTNTVDKTQSKVEPEEQKPSDLEFEEDEETEVVEVKTTTTKTVTTVKPKERRRSEDMSEAEIPERPTRDESTQVQQKQEILKQPSRTVSERENLSEEEETEIVEVKTVTTKTVTSTKPKPLDRHVLSQSESTQVDFESEAEPKTKPRPEMESKATQGDVEMTSVETETETVKVLPEAGESDEETETVEVTTVTTKTTKTAIKQKPKLSEQTQFHEGSVQTEDVAPDIGRQESVSVTTEAQEEIVSQPAEEKPARRVRPKQPEQPEGLAADIKPEVTETAEKPRREPVEREISRTVSRTEQMDEEYSEVVEVVERKSVMTKAPLKPEKPVETVMDQPQQVTVTRKEAPSRPRQPSQETVPGSSVAGTEAPEVSEFDYDESRLSHVESQPEAPEGVHEEDVDVSEIIRVVEETKTTTRKRTVKPVAKPQAVAIEDQPEESGEAVQQAEEAPVQRKPRALSPAEMEFLEESKVEQTTQVVPEEVPKRKPRALSPTEMEFVEETVVEVIPQATQTETKPVEETSKPVEAPKPRRQRPAKPEEETEPATSNISEEVTVKTVTITETQERKPKRPVVESTISNENVEEVEITENAALADKAKEIEAPSNTALALQEPSQIAQVTTPTCPTEEPKDFNIEADKRRTKERFVTESGAVEEVTTVSTKTKLTKEAKPLEGDNLAQAADVVTDVVTKRVIEKPVEVYVIEDENGDKIEIEVEERNGKLYNVVTGEEVELEGYETVNTTVEEFTEVWEMETTHETGKEPEVKGRMAQTYTTTTAKAEEGAVEKVVTGNVKTIDYKYDESGKQYEEKNEPILERQLLAPHEVLAIEDKGDTDGFVHETKEIVKQVRRRRPDGTEEVIPELEERRVESKRTAIEESQVVVKEEKPKEPEKPKAPSGPPKNVTVEKVTDTSARLTWEEPEGTQKIDQVEYVVEKKKSSRKIWSAVKTVTATEVDIGDLQEDEVYDFKVTPQNTLGAGESVQVPSVHTLTKPEAPENVQLAQTKPTPVLEWKKQETGPATGWGDIQKYIVQERDSENIRWHDLTELAPDATSFDVVFPNNVSEMDLRVLAVNDVGQSLPSKAVTVKNPVKDIKPKKPEAPVEKLDVVEVTDSDIQLTWEAPVDATAIDALEYVVEKKPIEKKTWEKVGTTKATSYQVSQLDEEEAYEFKVTPQNKLGKGQPSVTPEPVQLLSKPEQPQDVHVADTKEATVLEWSQPEPKKNKPVTGFKVEERSTDERTWNEVAKLPADTTSFEIPSELLESEREFRVVATNTVGQSAPSKTAPVHPVGSPKERRKVTTTTTTTTVTETVTEIEEEEEERPAPVAEVEEQPEEAPKQKEEVRAEPVKPKKTGQPSPPENLHVVESTPEAVTLGWEAPADEDRPATFQVEKKRSERKIWQNVTETSEEQYTVENLIEDSNYDFRVSTKTEDGLSEPAEILNVPAQFNQSVPVPPMKPVVVENTPSGVVLEWEDGESGKDIPVDGYLVSVREKGTKTWKKTTKELVKTKHYTITDLEAGAEYEAAVTAVNKAGESQPSATSESFTPVEEQVTEVKPEKKEAPHAPGKPVIKKASPNELTLSWDEPDNVDTTPVDSYKVELREAGSPWQKAKVQDVEKPEVTFTDLKKGVEYEARVTAVNAEGPSKPSDVSDAVHIPEKPKAADVPSAPGQPKVVTAGDSEIELAWADSPDDGGSPVLGYNVYIKEKGTKQWKKTTKTLAKTKSHKVQDLESAKEYEAQVTAVNEVGESEPSEVSKPFTVVEPKKETAEAPEAPQSPRELAVVDAKPSGVELSWAEPRNVADAPVSEYVVEEKPSTEKQWTPVGTTEDTSFVTPAVTPGDHDFRVIAKNDAGESKPVEVKRVHVEEAPKKAQETKVVIPAAPENLTVEDIAPDSVTLSWVDGTSDQGGKPDGYNVYVREKGTKQWKKVMKTLAKKKSHKLEELDAGAEYEAQVTAVNDAGESKPSEISEPFGLLPEEIELKPSVEVPAKPQDLVVVSAKPGGVTLSWAAPKEDTNAPVEDYLVETKPSSGKNWAPVGETDKTDLITPAIDEGKHDFRVVARNEAGSSEPITVNNVEVKKPETEKPGPPEAPGKPVVSNATDSEADVDWPEAKPTPKKPVDGYNVYVREKGKKEWKKVTKRVIKKNKHRLADLAEETEYEVQVTAVNDNGESQPSPASDSFKTEPKKTAPSKPRNLKVVEATPEKVTLTWETPESDGKSPITHFAVETKPHDAKTWKALATTEVPTFVAEKIGEGTHDFRVMARNDVGLSEPVELKNVEIKPAMKVPVAPGQPSVSGITQTEATLDWESPKPEKDKPVDGFNIYVREKGSKEWRKVTKELSKKKTYILKELTAGIEYDAHVTAVNQAGESEPSPASKPFKLKVVETVPAAPRDLEVTEAAVNNVKLCWSAPESDGNSPITGYVIEKRPKGDKTWRPAGESAEAEFTIPKIAEGTYDFRVVAVNKHGQSAPAELKDVEVEAAMKIPAAPGKPEVSDVTDTTATITWPAPEEDAKRPVDGYNIHVREKGMRTWKKVNKTLVKKNKTDLTELEKGKTYEAQVTAVNEMGESEPSAPSDAFQLLEPQEPPSAPENLRASDIKPDSVKLSWKAPVDEDGRPPVEAYVVLKKPKDAPEDQWDVVAEVPTTSTVVPNLESGASYDFRVVAKNKVGDSKPAELKDVQTASTIKVPAEPGKPSVTCTNTDATITWAEPKTDGGSPITGYHVYIRETGGSWKKVTRNAVTTKEFVSQNLTVGKAYEAQITAVNQAGESKASPPSDEFSLPKPKKEGPPMPPTDLHVAGVSPDSVVLVWKAPESGTPAASYVIKKRRTGRKAWQNVGETAELTFTVPELMENNNYDFAVFAVNKHGESEPAVIEDVYVKSTIKVPSAPGQPQVSEVTDLTVTIEWPEINEDDNGGSPVTGYDVYIRPKPASTWRKVTKTKTTQRTHVFENLEKLVEYEARVTASNAAGESEPSKPSEPFSLASATKPTEEKPVEPEAFVEAAEEAAAVEPEDIDKAPKGKAINDTVEVVEGEDAEFEIEFSGSPVPTIKWDGLSGLFSDRRRFVITTTETRSKCVIKKCTLQDTGDLSVLLKNKVGKAEIPMNLKVVQKTVPPRIIECPVSVDAQTGDNINLLVKFEGIPYPDVEWIFQEKTLKETRRSRVESYKDYESKLVIKKLEKSDVGTYTVRVTNSAGVAEAQVSLTVTGAPSAPRNLKVAEINPEKATITWDAPESDGGSPILKYVIEKRSAGRVTWSKVTTTQKLEAVIDDLAEGKMYEFRVFAENKFGAGEAAEVGPVLAAYTFDVPSAPGAPECSETTTSSTVLNWNPSDSDGGSPILGYHVERRVGKVGRWTKINKTTITTTTLVVEDLVEGETYEFRVLAENKRGLSKPSLPGSPLKVPTKKEAKAEASRLESISKKPEITRTDDLDKTVDDTIGSDVELEEEEELPQDEEKGTKPEFVTPLETQIVKESQKAVFECEVVGDPKPSIIWQKNGKTIRDSEEFRYVVKGNVYQLVVREAFMEDAGVYQVIARNTAGKATSDADLIVKKEAADSSKGQEVPSFITPLRNLTVIEGQLVNLRARAAGIPTPSLKWYKGETEISPADTKYKVIHDGIGGSTLSILSIDLEDADIYRCVAANAAGEVSTEGTLSVEPKKETGKEAPYFTKTLQEVTVVESNELKLDCAFVGHPAPNVKWFLNDKPIQSSKDITIISDSSTSTLVIYSAMPEDTGLYTVEISNAGGKAKSFAGVNVRRAPKEQKPMGIAPRFTKRFTDTEVAVGYDVHFECQVTGEEMPKVIWYFEKKEIKEEPGKYQVTHKEKIGWSSLIVRNVTLENIGLYKAVAKNSEGEASCTAYLNAIEPRVLEGKTADHVANAAVKAPAFAKPLRDAEVVEGDEIRLECRLSEPMEVHVRWSKDGIELDNGGRHHIESFPDGTMVLTIKEARTRDAARYTCTVSNAAGRAKTSCEIRVAVPKDDESRRDDSQSSKRKRVAGPPWPMASAPTLIDVTDTGCHISWKPSLTESTEDTPITYIVEMCQVPRNDWRPIAHGLPNTEYHVVDLLKPEPNYHFRIRAENKYGVSDPSPYARTDRKPPPAEPRRYSLKPSDKKQFEVEPKEYTISRPERGGFGEKPRFYGDTSEIQYGLEGETATLECYCYGHPQPRITWYHRGEEIKSGGRYMSRYGISGQVQLSIEKLSFRDIGEYSCKAVNEHGEAQMALRLEVADPPVFIESIVDASFIPGQPARLDCRVDGTPFPEVRWLKDWRPIALSNRIEAKVNEFGYCSLIFHDVRTFDGGLYTCEAKNIGGTAMCSANIFVESRPAPTAAPYDVHVRRVNLKTKRVTDFYDFYEEIGRGTQAVVKRAAEKLSGRNYAAKISFAPPRERQWLENEMAILNELQHPNIVRLHDGYAGNSYVVLMLELARGGEIIPRLTENKTYGEDYVRQIIKQILQTLEYIHDKGYAHLDLKPEDVLFQSPQTDRITLVDFGIAQKIPPSGQVISEFGTPEFVSPEIASRSPCGTAADLWSTGIITYLLLSGHSPFLGPTDRDTLLNVQKGEWDFSHPIFAGISAEGKDFISSLLKKEANRRLNAKEALEHPWFKSSSNADIDSRPLGDYWNKRKHKLGQEAVVKYARRRPLQSCLQHPQGLLYPPDVADSLNLGENMRVREGTPGPRSSADREVPSRRASEDFRDYHYSFFGTSESNYQVGPETELLQLRDPDLPTRIREYRRLVTDPTGHASSRVKIDNKLWGLKPAVKERRRMMEIMDEEGFGPAQQLAERKKRRRILDEQTEEYAPFFREKLKDTAYADGKPVTLRVVVIGNPLPTVHWYHHDMLLDNGPHIRTLMNEDGTALLTLSPATAVEAGEYKCVARNKLGESVCRATLQLGVVPDHPSWPVLEYVSPNEMTLSWESPEFDGNAEILAYKLEYRSREDSAWKVVAADLLHENIVVQNLQPNTHYRFRVACRNMFGWSNYSFSSNEYRTLMEGDSPRMVEKLAKDSQLKWRERAAEPKPPKPERLMSLMEKYPAQLHEDTNPEDHIEFFEEIARGEFSIVRKCFDQKAQAAFAAKIIDMNAPDARHEYEMLSSLKNDSIINLHSAYTYNGLLVLVEDKLEGYDILTHLCEMEVYTEEDVSHIIRQVLDGLQYLHYLGMAHLNLQPENIVSKSRRKLQVQLVDFGAARKLPEEGAVIKLPTVPLEFTMPEVLTGKPTTVSADIWSVGVLVFIMLSGTHPFLGEDDDETYKNVCGVRYRASELYRGLSVESTRLIMQTLKVLPGNRLSVDECLEHRWITPNEISIKKREKSTFHCYRLRQYRQERRRNLLRRQTANQALTSAFNPKETSFD